MSSRKSIGTDKMQQEKPHLLRRIEQWNPTRRTPNAHCGRSTITLLFLLHRKRERSCKFTTQLFAHTQASCEDAHHHHCVHTWRVSIAPLDERVRAQASGIQRENCWGIFFVLGQSVCADCTCVAIRSVLNTQNCGQPTLAFGRASLCGLNGSVCGIHTLDLYYKCTLCVCGCTRTTTLGDAAKARMLAESCSRWANALWIARLDWPTHTDEHVGRARKDECS